MAAIEALLLTKLTGTTGVSTLVGTRVHPNVLPQNVTYPAIRYLLTDSPAQNVTGKNRFLRARVQLDVYGATYAAAKAVAVAVRSALNRWSAPTDGVILAWIDDETDVDDAEEQMARISMDVVITYRE